MNLVTELNRIAARNAQAEIDEANQILDSVKAHLTDEAQADNDMLKYFGTAETVKSTKQSVAVSKKKLEGNVLSVEDIKSVCLKYGLRFLPAKQYVKEVPLKALNDLRNFSQTTKIWDLDSRLYMIAPVSHFKLGPKPEKDPVLVYRNYNSQYEIVSQWGTDFSFTRRIYGFLMGKFSYLFVAIVLIAMSFGVLQLGLFANSLVDNNPGWAAPLMVATILLAMLNVGLYFFMFYEGHKTHHSRWNKSTV